MAQMNAEARRPTGLLPMQPEQRMPALVFQQRDADAGRSFAINDHKGKTMEADTA